MNRNTAYKSLSTGIGIRSRIVILIMFALSFHARASYGQSEKGYESLLISDASIPDFLALAKSDPAKENSIKILLKIKKDSLEGRLTQADLSLERVNRRKEKAESFLELWRKSIDDNMQQTQMKSSVFLISRAAAEQLLIAAQLELQKVYWDLASEVASSEMAAKLRNAESQTELFERQLAKVESKSIEEELHFAEKQLQRTESMEKEGAIDTLEADRVRLSVSKAKNSLAIHELRSQLAEAQHIALKDTNSVESETQIRRLTSRKDQIEKYIGELVSAMKDLYPREELLNRADRINQTIATLTKLVDEMETKRDEINGLLNTVNSEKSDEKKK